MEEGRFEEDQARRLQGASTRLGERQLGQE